MNRRGRRRTFIALTVAAFLSACGSTDTVPDATVPDAAVPDATVPDATVFDATVPDATVPDAGGSASCGLVRHGQRETRSCYDAMTAPAGDACTFAEQTRTCSDGTWEPDWPACDYLTCTDGPPVSCEGTPDGGEEMRLCYPSSAVPTGSTCTNTEQTRTCSGGAWSTWPECRHLSCTVEPPSATVCEGVGQYFCEASAGCFDDCAACGLATTGLTDAGWYCAQTRSFRMGVLPTEATLGGGTATLYRTLAESAEIVSYVQPVTWIAEDTLPTVSVASAYYTPLMAAVRAENPVAEFMISMDVLATDRGSVQGFRSEWLTPPGGDCPTEDFSCAPLRAQFIQEALNLEATHNPAYLVLGVEINTYGMTTDIADFASLYAETYDALAATGRLDDTKVCALMNYETLVAPEFSIPGRGQEYIMAQLVDGGRMDTVCFSSYPEMRNGTLDNLRANERYYRDVFESARFSGREIVFTELGWQGGSWGVRSASGEADQAAFIDWFLTTFGDHVSVVIWTMLHDVIYGSTPEEEAALSFFFTMGLVDRTGAPKPSWYEWLGYIALPYVR